MGYNTTGLSLFYAILETYVKVMTMDRDTSCLLTGLQFLAAASIIWLLWSYVPPVFSPHPIHLSDLVAFMLGAVSFVLAVIISLAHAQPGRKEAPKKEG